MSHCVVETASTMTQDRRTKQSSEPSTRRRGTISSGHHVGYLAQTTIPPYFIPRVAEARLRSVFAAVDAAFGVYGERAQQDLREFRTLCGTMVLQEQQEKEQWRNLCAKIMRERDEARAVIRRGSIGVKREHDADQLPLDAAVMPEIKPRVVRPLPASRSPSPEAHGSPSSAQPQRPYTPQRTRSAPPFSPPVMEIPQPKRRRSCGRSSVEFSPSSSPEPERRTLRRDTGSAPTPARTNPIDFTYSHMDLMFKPVEAGLECRACLIEAARPGNSHKNVRLFARDASWDELKEHCIYAHPDACIDISRLHPAEIFELRRRLCM